MIIYAWIYSLIYLLPIVAFPDQQIHILVVVSFCIEKSMIYVFKYFRNSEHTSLLWCNEIMI